MYLLTDLFKDLGRWFCVCMEGRGLGWGCVGVGVIDILVRAHAIIIEAFSIFHF